jgi:nitrate reductase / nitrite oxidoreductase, alpha subunit
LTPAQTEADHRRAGGGRSCAWREEIAANPRDDLFATGMGPNQFFNADLKDRAIFLVAALTRNVGFPGGNVGSYAGNYRLASSAACRVRPRIRSSSARPRGPVAHARPARYESAALLQLRRPAAARGQQAVHRRRRTCRRPPRRCGWANSNSVLGNVKWHFDVVHNTLPKVETIAFADWWWTGSCEYADIVFGVDSWAEFKQPDMTASVHQPVRADLPAHAAAARLRHALRHRGRRRRRQGARRALGEPRFVDGWKFVGEGQASRSTCSASSTQRPRFAATLRGAGEGASARRPGAAADAHLPAHLGWEQSAREQALVHAQRPPRVLPR